MLAIPAILLFLIVAFETIEQLAFADGAKRNSQKLLRWAIGIIAHIGGILVWLPLLAIIPISVAVPLTALCYISTSFAAKIWLDEKLTQRRLMGIALIALGTGIIYFDGGWIQ